MMGPQDKNITRIHGVTFPRRICRACLLADSNCKYIEVKHKYEILQQLTSIDIDTDDLENGWLCLICSARISSIHKFCNSIRKSDDFLKMLADQLKTYTNGNQAILAGLESLHFCNIAKRNLTMIQLPIVNVLKYPLSPNEEIKTESSIEFDQNNTVSIIHDDLIKDEEYPEMDPLMGVDSDMECKDNNFSMDNDSDKNEFTEISVLTNKKVVSKISLKPVVKKGLVSKIKKKKVKGKKVKEKKLKQKKLMKKVSEKKLSKVLTVTLTKEEFLEEFQSKALDENFTSAEYKCTLCVRTFVLESSLNSHMDRHKEVNGEFECRYCHLRFPTRINCIDHEHRHLRRYKCSKCDFHRFFKSAVVGHYADIHDQLTVDDCQMCGKSFKSSFTKSMHACDKQIGCDKCGKLVTKSYLKIHMKRRHGGEKEFTCQICNRKYATVKLLEVHIKRQHGVPSEDNYCEECNSYFTSKESYLAHLKYSSKHVNKEILRSCPYCPERMANWRLKIHINKEHLKIRPFGCDKCIKKFFALRTLQQHLKRVHDRSSIAKKYVCEICGKGFTSKQVLIQHLNTHTGARPYKCAQCQCSFSHKATLFTHNKLVHLKQKRKLQKSLANSAEDELQMEMNEVKFISQ